MKQQSNIKSNPESTGNLLATTLFQNWLNPTVGRRSRRNTNHINDHKNLRPIKQLEIFLPFINDIADNKIQQEFHRHFIYGVEMQIWRKGKLKKVQVILDLKIESFLWFSTKTKAFLFDLCFTTVSSYDYQLQKLSKIKDMIILRYFGQQIPIIFRGQSRNEVNYYLRLFERYVFWNKVKNSYPPYFSKLLRIYTMEIVKQNITRRKTIEDIIRISDEMNINSKQKNYQILKNILLSQHFKSNINIKTGLDNSHINSFIKIIHCNLSIRSVYQKYSRKKLFQQLDFLKPFMSKEYFKAFLEIQQTESKEAIQQILKQTKQFISFYDFSSYLERQAQNYAAEAPNIDESLPLTDYFCYSSHNTYLSGNQLTSDSKIERYVQDLMGGLKCVEIDVHNDGDNPIITHALRDKSLCKPIDFQQTIKQINKFCQSHPNHYPIILSIENHAKQQNRYKMVNIMVRHFQRKVLYLGQQYNNLQFKQCKPLSYLRGKIIIKTDSKIEQLLQFKQKPHQFIIQKTPMSQVILPFTYDQKKQFQNKQFQNQKNKFDHFFQAIQRRKNLFRANLPKHLGLPLAEMTKVTSMFKSSQGVDKANSIGYECTSLTNSKAENMSQNKLIDYTKRSWLRIYPLGTEIASSNYNPIPHLKVGAQIIALNTQTKDDYAWLLRSYFTAGRQSNSQNIGYIQKPLHLRSQVKREQKQIIYEIKNYSNEKINIRFIGTEADMKVNQASQSIFKIKDYLEGFLIFELRNSHKDCIPLRFIRRGYRVLVIKNQLFLDSGIRVLIHISIT